MEKVKFHLRAFTVKGIRDYILDHSVSNQDTFILSQYDFDELALDYRNTYAESIEVPYILLGVLIREDETNKIQKGTISHIKNDLGRSAISERMDLKNSGPDSSYEFETIYRCGWCGNVVDYDGSELNNDTLAFQISVLDKFKNTINQPHVTGYCCRNKERELYEKQRSK